MGLAEMGRVVRRRWYVLVPLLLLAALLTGVVERAVPRQYQSTGMVSLLASQQSIKGTSQVPGTGNPFLSFDSSLNDTADFLVRRLESTDAARELAAEGVSGYTAALAASQGPFIDLTADGATSDAARAAMTTLIGYTGKQLAALQQQQGVPVQDQITSAVIVPGSPPEALSKRRVQDTLGTAAAGLALAVLATFATDSLAARRRRRRARGPVRRAAAPAAPPSPDAPRTRSMPPPEERAGGGRQAPAERGGGELIGPLSEARD